MLTNCFNVRRGNESDVAHWHQLAGGGVSAVRRGRGVARQALIDQAVHGAGHGLAVVAGAGGEGAHAEAWLRPEDRPDPQLQGIKARWVEEEFEQGGSIIGRWRASRVLRLGKSSQLRGKASRTVRRLRLGLNAGTERTDGAGTEGSRTRFAATGTGAPLAYLASLMIRGYRPPRR